MFHDMMTVVWKETREVFGRQSSVKGGKRGLIFFLAVFGILMPLQFGKQWITSPLSMVYWAWVPFLMVSAVVADAFAGERERHTLETLLASRLPDRAILAGKIAAAMAYGWGMTLVCIVSGTIAINIVYGKGHLIIYALPVALGIIGLTFLVALFGSGLGVLVSLRAATVKQAQQTFSVAFMIIFIPMFILPFLPPGLKTKLFASVAHVNPVAVVAAVAAFLLAADILLILVAAARFKRARLILD
jgi:ABC-2 type transport system permease protein